MAVFRDKNGRILKGSTHTEETKKKISESKKGENHPMYGKKHTEESKAKNSFSHSLRTWTPEQRENSKNRPQNTYWLGKKRSEKDRALISQRTKEAMARPEVREKLLKNLKPSPRLVIHQIKDEVPDTCHLPANCGEKNAKSVEYDLVMHNVELGTHHFKGKCIAKLARKLRVDYRDLRRLMNGCLRQKALGGWILVRNNLKNADK